MKQKQIWLIWLLLFLTLFRVDTYTELQIGNTTLWWIIEFVIILLIAAVGKNIGRIDPGKFANPVKYLLIWNAICIIRGFLIAENYWEWKNLLGTGLMLFIPLIVYVSSDLFFLQKLLRKWFTYMPWLFFLFIPFTIGVEHGADLYGKYFVPVLFLLPFIYLLPVRYRIFILIISIIVLLFSLDARSNIIRFLVAGFLGFAFYFRRLIRPQFLKICSFCFFILPIVLLVLGISGKFNVFKMDEYISGEYTTQVVKNGEIKDASLTADTRSFLYVEVLQSAIKNDYFFVGRTPARGYDSVAFGEFLAEDLGTGKNERFGSEVAIHNIFTWNGLTGVFLYFLVFYKASLLALYRSNSYTMKLLGVFVAFRWLFAFIEDFTVFELQYIFLWITIGICYSSKFREMDDYELKLWVRGIFDKRYREYYYNLPETSSPQFQN